MSNMKDGIKVVPLDIPKDKYTKLNKPPNPYLTEDQAAQDREDWESYMADLAVSVLDDF